MLPNNYGDSKHTDKPVSGSPVFYPVFKCQVAFLFQSQENKHSELIMCMPKPAEKQAPLQIPDNET